MEIFLNRYSEFETIIRDTYPSTVILLENRCGTRYSGGKFIVSSINQIVELSNYIDNSSLNLKITLDIPQLFTAHFLRLLMSFFIKFNLFVIMSEAYIFGGNG